MDLNSCKLFHFDPKFTKLKFRETKKCVTIWVLVIICIIEDFCIEGIDSSIRICFFFIIFEKSFSDLKMFLLSYSVEDFLLKIRKNFSDRYKFK